MTRDVAEQLGTEPSTATGPRPDVLVLRGSLDRESLRLGVLDLPSPAHRLGWLADHLDQLPGSGIVYTLTVASATETAEFLRSRGWAVAAYTGQAEDADRRAAEQDLLDNKIKALVATSALGMGFDKPDLGFVVHLGAPPSPIAYYQQVGRAGRAVEHAEVLLLPGAEDAAIWRYFASLAFPPEEQVRAVLAALHTDRPLSTQALEPLVDLRRARLELMLKVLDVDGAVRRVRGAGSPPARPGPTTRPGCAASPPPVPPNNRPWSSTRRPPAAGCVTCGNASTTWMRWTAAGATAAPGPCSRPRCRRPR